MPHELFESLTALENAVAVKLVKVVCKVEGMRLKVLLLLVSKHHKVGRLGSRRIEVLIEVIFEILLIATRRLCFLEGAFLLR